MTFLINTYKKKQIPIIASIPHSGVDIPLYIKEQFTSGMSQALPNVDWYLHYLYDFLPSLGITTIQATHYRYVVDLNRALRNALVGGFGTAVVANTIPSGTPFSEKVYKQEPTHDDIQQRIVTYYNPYHQALLSLLTNMLEKFPTVYLVDLHSFVGGLEEEVCLGNRNEQTCQNNFLQIFQEGYTKAGFSTVCNKKFLGGYITQKYTNMPKIQTLQVEIKASSYLPLQELDQNRPPSIEQAHFDSCKNKLQSVFAYVLQNYIW